MAETGKELGVDLYDLLVVAEDYLPSVSGYYATMIADLSRSHTAAAAAMTRPAHFGGGSHGPEYASWLQANEAVTAVLTSMRTSLDQTSTALIKAVALYRAADQGASDELNARYNRHRPTPSDRP